MLHKWIEILPLFVVRILAKRFCERLNDHYENGQPRVFMAARPDVFFKLPPK